MRKLENSATKRLLEEAQALLGLTSTYQLAQALDWEPGYTYRYARGEITMGPGKMLDFSNKTGIPLKTVVSAASDDERSKQQLTNGRAIQTRRQIGVVKEIISKRIRDLPARA